MEWTNKGGVPSELPTVAEAKERILTDVPNILGEQYPEDELYELVDSDLPIYFSEILYQWGKLPSEWVDSWKNGHLGETDQKLEIFTLMGGDLYEFYSDVYAKALAEIKEEAGE
jgi:hypothetical protein